MSNQNQTVKETIEELANVTAVYLNEEEVQALVDQWQKFDSISVAMMQQCMLDTVKFYPKLKPYKSKIRRRFWHIIETKSNPSHDSQDRVANAADSNAGALNETTKNSELLAFHSVINTLKQQLNQQDLTSMFAILQKLIARERSLNGYSINMVQFMSDKPPSLPNDGKILNNLVQLIYVSLCDIVGPSEADDILYRSAEIAKHKFTHQVVEALF